MGVTMILNTATQDTVHYVFSIYSCGHTMTAPIYYSRGDIFWGFWVNYLILKGVD